jgi:hypothetical protein
VASVAKKLSKSEQKHTTFTKKHPINDKFYTKLVALRLAEWVSEKVLKSTQLLLKNTQLLEENDHFFQKNAKTAKNTVFTPKNIDFERP